MLYVMIKNKRIILLFVLLLFRLSGVQYDYVLKSSNIDGVVKDQISLIDSVLVSQYEPLSSKQINGIYKQVFKSTINKIDSRVLSYAKKTGFNGTILLAKDGVTIFKRNIGYSNFENKLAINDSSEFQLASVSKQFTSVAILLLAEENKLDIDDDINKYFPKLNLKDVHIKHLLNHTAGLSDYIPIVLNKWTEKYAPTNLEVIKLLEKNRLKQRFIPSTQFQYSNTGYFLLASIVEKITGMTLNNYLTENVFIPLGMNHTKVYDSGHTEWGKEQLKGYRKNKYYYSAFNQSIIDGVVGDKGVYASADDLAKWTDALFNGEIINDEMLSKAIEKSHLDNGTSVRYGYGLRVFEDYNGTMIYHNGSWGGFRTTSRYYIDESVSLIVLSNNSYTHLGELARRVKNTFDDNNGESELLCVVKNILLKKKVDNSKIQISIGKKNEMMDIVALVKNYNHQWLAQEFQSSISLYDNKDYEFYALADNTISSVINEKY